MRLSRNSQQPSINLGTSLVGFGRQQVLSAKRDPKIQLITANDFHFRLDIWRIQIEAHGDTLVFNGRVPSWYLKQPLHETLRHVDGVGSVESRVVVVKPGDNPSHGQTYEQ